MITYLARALALFIACTAAVPSRAQSRETLRWIQTLFIAEVEVTSVDTLRFEWVDGVNDQVQPEHFIHGMPSVWPVLDSINKAEAAKEAVRYARWRADSVAMEKRRAKERVPMVMAPMLEERVTFVTSAHTLLRYHCRVLNLMKRPTYSELPFSADTFSLVIPEELLEQDTVVLRAGDVRQLYFETYRPFYDRDYYHSGLSTRFDDRVRHHFFTNDLVEYYRQVSMLWIHPKMVVRVRRYPERWDE